MNNKAIIGISLLLVLFLSGCTADPTGKVIYLPVDANITSNDTNQVKVSSNDTTPNYLFSKLAQGTNITLSILNPGGDETVEISASGSFTDLNKVGVSATDNSPDYLFSKLQAGTGISLAIQNPGGNENVLITSTGGTDTNCSTSPDCNNLYVQKNPLITNTIRNTNGVQFILQQDGNVGNSTSVGGAFLLDNTDNNGAGLIIYSNIGSEANGRLLNIRADNTGFDQAVVHIDNDGTANTLEITNNSTDSSAQALNVVSNNPNDTTLGINGVETSKGTLKIVHNVAGGDSSASGISIDLQGTGTEAQGIYVDSTATTGTIGNLLRLRNQSIDKFIVTKDGNAHSKGDINGLRLCINNDCRTSWPTSSSGGTTYTSGTPATIEVNNDSNTISQNFDGNFWRMFALGEPYIDGNALVVINSLDLNNSLNYAKKTDGNGSILGTTNQVSVTNGLSRLFGDQNVVLSLPQNIDTTATPTFSELTLTLGSGSCFNVNVGAQQRFDVDCSTNTTTSGTHLPNQPGISDIGNSSNRWDDFFITDVNATGTSDFKTLCIGGDCKTNWPVSVSSDTNCSTSGDCNSMYIQKNPLADQNINNQDLNIYNGQLVLHAGSNIASSNDNIFEIWNQNGTRTLRTDQNGNMVLDGNLTFVDANSFVGGVGATQGRRVRYNGLDYTGNATTGGGNLWINANTYAFAVTGTLTSGLYFDASAPRGFKFRIDGGERFIFGAGSANTDGAIWQIIRNSGTTGMLDGAWYFKDIGQKDMNWQPYIRRNGIENHWNAQVYLGTPKDLIIDGNWIGDINAKGDYHIDGNMVVDHNIYGQLVMAGNLVGVSCNTTCGAIGYAGPWNCVEADNVTGAASTCSDITVAHNCLCRN